jgi:penicillin-binding protein 1A
MTLHADPKHPKKSGKTKKHSGDDRPRRGFLVRAFFFCLKWGFVVGVWATLIVLGVAAWYARELPEITRAPNIERKPSITILANDGSVVARYGDIKGDSLTIKDMPPDLIHAVLATEDRRFYYHFGLDPIGVLRAVVVNVTRKGVVQGGSTITQQLAKNLFLTQDRTLKRKIQEALLALWLERELTKDEILSAYLNRVYMGAGAYGVDAAAQIYFKKSARDLNLRESAILAGLLKAPSKFSPRSNPRLAGERADIVIANMKDAGYLKNTGEDRVKNRPIPGRKPVANDSNQYFGDYIVEQLDDLIGLQARDLIIETTFDPDIQRAGIAALNKAIAENGAAKHISQGSIIVTRRDGAILSLIGGKDYAQSQFNRATHALRPPGSSFKPIVYLTALENGYTPDTLVNDVPITEGDYKPTNFDDKYYGEIPIRLAFAYSLNTIAIQLAQQVGINAVIDTSRRMGITADLVPNYSTALGANGVPQIEMSAAYTSIANGGLGVTPYGILKITDTDKNILYEQSPLTDYPRVASKQAILDLITLMQGTIQVGTGQGAHLGSDIYAAGKTGTSQDYRDAWFSGFTESYIATIWVGNDNNSSMKRVTGGSIPAVIWRETMIAALNDPTPAPDHVPVGSDGAFGGLLDRVLSYPGTSSGDASNDSGTAYDGNPRDESSEPSGKSIWWWNRDTPSADTPATDAAPDTEGSPGADEPAQLPIVDGVYSPARDPKTKQKYNN